MLSLFALLPCAVAVAPMYLAEHSGTNWWLWMLLCSSIKMRHLPLTLPGSLFSSFTPESSIITLPSKPSNCRGCLKRQELSNLSSNLISSLIAHTFILCLSDSSINCPHALSLTHQLELQPDLDLPLCSQGTVPDPCNQLLWWRCLFPQCKERQTEFVLCSIQAKQVVKMYNPPPPHTHTR